MYTEGLHAHDGHVCTVMGYMLATATYVDSTVIWSPGLHMYIQGLHANDGHICRLKGHYSCHGGETMVCDFPPGGRRLFIANDRLSGYASIRQ
jgi:hypothetical protein